MKIQNFITDEVGVINEKEIALFNKTLKTLYERDGEDVRFIFISDDICWDSEEDFLLTNNIGDPQRHNGMVFILNIKDNQVRVFAWKGLYLKYTDIFKHQYVENIIKPHLTNRKYKQIIETWIYDHNGSSILDNFQEIDRTKWNLLAILFPFIFIPFLAYTLFDILKQIGYTVSLFAVGLISYLAYVKLTVECFYYDVVNSFYFHIILFLLMDIIKHARVRMSISMKKIQERALAVTLSYFPLVYDHSIFSKYMWPK